MGIKVVCMLSLRCLSNFQVEMSNKQLVLQVQRRENEFVHSDDVYVKWILKAMVLGDMEGRVFQSGLCLINGS